MNSKYVVSIIIPTFNRANLLSKAIETAISQTIYCEVIVCDHGSKDDTREVVARYKDRVRYIRRELDSGPFFSWLDGILHAGSDFVHITHDDDWIEDNFIEKFLSVFSPS